MREYRGEALSTLCFGAVGEAMWQERARGSAPSLHGRSFLARISKFYLDLAHLRTRSRIETEARCSEYLLLWTIEDGTKSRTSENVHSADSNITSLVVLPSPSEEHDERCKSTHVLEKIIRLLLIDLLGRLWNGWRQDADDVLGKTA